MATRWLAIFCLTATFFASHAFARPDGAGFDREAVAGLKAKAIETSAALHVDPETETDFYQEFAPYFTQALAGVQTPADLLFVFDMNVYSIPFGGVTTGFFLGPIRAARTAYLMEEARRAHLVAGLENWFLREATISEVRTYARTFSLPIRALLADKARMKVESCAASLQRRLRTR